MARDWLSERTFRTYAGWKRAVKQLAPEAKFEGDKDIAYAFTPVGPSRKPEGIGEWDGDKGVIYESFEQYIRAHGNPPKRLKGYTRVDRKYRRNPGAKYHTDKMQEAEAEMGKYRGEDRAYFAGHRDAHSTSRFASEKLHINRKRKKMRRNPGRDWHSEWRTTYNMLSKRAIDDLDRKYLEGKRDANDDAVNEEDRRSYSGHERRVNPRKRKRKRMRRNCNPRKGAVEIYGNILAIEARKGKSSLWPNEKFRHGFKSKSEAKVYGLPDGSLLIKSKSGKRLWKNFKYKKGVDY